MLSQFRGPGGRFSLLAAGIACLLLAGFALVVPVPGLSLALSAALVVAALACFWRTWSLARADRYDLSKLFDAPPPEPEEPRYDHIPDDEVSSPYCGWCDEAYPPGTKRCQRCGREL